MIVCLVELRIRGAAAAALAIGGRHDQLTHESLQRPTVLHEADGEVVEQGDVGQVLAAPFAGMILADLGAVKEDGLVAGLAQLAAGEVERYLQLNQLFHLTLYRAGQPQVLIPLIESLWLQFGPFMRATIGQT